jgi:PEP-CTERM motif
MTHIGGIRRRLVAFGLSLGLVVGLAKLALAGPLFPGGLPHPLANLGSSGTVQLRHDADNNPITPNQYYGDVEFAVFTAANFLTVFPGQDTPNGGVAAGEAVYAYQVINSTPAGDTLGDITQFSVGLADLGGANHFGDGLDDNELVIAGDQDFIPPGPPGQVPSLSQVIASAIHAPSGSSVRYSFNDGTDASHLGPGESSAILFYTSPFGPRFDNASTTTGQGQSRVPAPEVGVPPGGGIPEPTSLALASLGVAAIGVCRRRRACD